MERCESRYFFESSSGEEIRACVETIKGLLLIEYPNPVTETVYFTFGKKTAYAVPANQLVRIRRYVSKLSEVIVFGHEDVFVEIKTDCANGLNHKDRFVLPGSLALSVLAKDVRIQSMGYISQGVTHLPPLFPTVATQVERQHWIHKSGMRITLDKEIRMFTFFDESLEGHYAESLGEGKIEFKSPKSLRPGDSLVRAIVTNKMCIQKEPAYLERRLKECFFQSTKKDIR